MWFGGGYETLVLRQPKLWGHLYRSSDRPLWNFWFQTALDWIFCKNIELLIQTFRPTWVICTHSLPQPRLATLAKHYKFRTAVVITDLHPHRMWMRGKPDQYYVPLAQTKALLERRLPSARGKIDVAGMPINPVFRGNEREDSSGAIRVILAAGGIGGGPIEAAAAELAKLPIRLSIVTGRNETLFNQVEQRFAGVDNVHVFSFMSQEELAEQMASADILVSKPGGLTTFEALASGIAFVVLEDLLIPGQEEDNAKFLVDSGAGLIAKDLGLVATAVVGLIGDPKRLRGMQSAALHQSKPQATKEIADHLLSL